jgi:hypothetical protein
LIVDGGELVITFQLLPFNGQFSIKKMKAMLISIVSPPEMIANKQIIQADLSILRKAKK